MLQFADVCRVAVTSRVTDDAMRRDIERVCDKTMREKLPTVSVLKARRAGAEEYRRGRIRSKRDVNCRLLASR